MAGGALQIQLNRGQRLLKCQAEMLRSRAVVKGCFGGWGSGKTLAGALCLLDNAVANPWREDYGENYPTGIVIGLTHKVLLDSGYRTLKQLIPKEAIRQEWKSPEWRLLLTNGYQIIFRTASGSIEGVNACGLWLDEAHLLPSATTYLNYQMRVRDVLGRQWQTIVTGLPEHGWLQETFADTRGDARRTTVLAATKDNHYLPRHVIEQYLASCSRSDQAKLLEGQWMSAEGAIYDAFGDQHLFRHDPDRSKPIAAIAIDVGERGAVLWAQKSAQGITVVDEYYPRRQSAAATMRHVLSRGWRFDSETVVLVDPKTDRDELDAIYESLGQAGHRDVPVIRRDRGDDSYYVEYGIRCVRAALEPMEGPPKLKLWAGLTTDEASILTAIPKFRRNPKNGKPIKDNITDHALDCLRYLVQYFFPTKRDGITQEAYR